MYYKTMVTMTVPFWVSEEVYKTLSISEVMDKIKRNINGWQYSNANIGSVNVTKKTTFYSGINTITR